MEEMNSNQQLQELLEYFDPTGQEPVQGPHRQEYDTVRRMLETVGTPCAIVVGAHVRGETLPADVTRMVDQMCVGVNERIAALHAKVFATSAPSVS